MLTICLLKTAIIILSTSAVLTEPYDIQAVRNEND